MSAIEPQGWDQEVSLAVAGLIASRRSGGRARIIASPEVEERTAPAVELITSDGIGELAIEHTRIEAFDGQIADPHMIAGYSEPLTELVEGRLPTGSRFELVLAVNAARGAKPSGDRLDRLAEWIVEHAPLLPDGRPGIAGRHMVRCGPPVLPFDATLARWPADPGGPLPPFSVGYWKPDDLEDRRRDRVRRALEAKVPKLLDAATGGRQSVLLLESNDIQLSNAWDIGQAVRDAAGTDPLPAWIVLVETETEPALAWILRTPSEGWVAEPDHLSLSIRRLPEG